MGVLLRKRIQLIATTLKSRSDTYKADLISQVGEKLFPASGPKLQAVVDKEFKMSEASAAHVYMEGNTTVGKIVLKQDM